MVDGASYHKSIDPSYVALYGHGPLYGNVNPKELVADYHHGCQGLGKSFKAGAQKLLAAVSSIRGVAMILQKSCMWISYETCIVSLPW